MARSLPVFIASTPISVIASSSAPSGTTDLPYGEAAVAIVGANAGLASTGGKVTLTVRDGDSLITSPVIYQVEFDFTSARVAANVQQTPIPCFGVPSYTVQADATANGKGFGFGVTLQKIAIN